jgi:5-methylcytosine-specific restriction endonuclease McrA
MDFYQTPRWRALRYNILKRSNGKCDLCGTKNELHVDHIKPRSKYPDLQWDESNLQTLCSDCNRGKSNLHTDDWRKNRVLPVLNPEKLRRYLKTQYEPFEVENFVVDPTQRITESKA